MKICKNPSEDLLYTVRRLIGGLASTGVEFRKGFSLTFSLLVSKFGKDLNMKEILDCIEKESFVPKNEKMNIQIMIYIIKIYEVKTNYLLLF